MPFLDDHGPGNESYFNVRHSVGERAANFWTDIMLVQYFIRKIYTWGNWADLPMFPTRSDEYLLDPHKDFKKTHLTAEFIRRFQHDIRFTGVPVATDGRVSVGKPVSSNIRFTIHLLNSTYRSILAIYGDGEDWQGYLLNDTELPDMCKGEIIASISR